MKKLLFIGAGKMATAIAGGLVRAKLFTPGELQAYDVSETAAAEFTKATGVACAIRDCAALARDAERVLLAVKPQTMTAALAGLSEVLSGKPVITIIAGVPIARIAELTGSGQVIRVMPNTPALVLEGMSGVCKGAYAKEEDVEFVLELLSNIGKAIEVDEDQIDIVTAISGSGPAFFYKVIEDMARAGEKLGLEYEKSLELATQTALGSAKMVMNRGEIPVQTLIDNVATKGGCTFVGISVMNDEASQKLFYDVISKTAEKAGELGK